MDSGARSSSSDNVSEQSIPAPIANRRKRAYLVLCFGLLLLSTPVAILQTFHSLSGILGLAMHRHWLLEPTVLPPNSDLPYVAGNIRAVSRTDHSIWIGGDAGLLAHSEDEGKTWHCLSLIGENWSASSCGSTPRQPEPAVLAIEWGAFHTGTMVAGNSLIYLTRDGATWSPMSAESASINFPTVKNPSTIAGVPTQILSGNKLMFSPPPADGACKGLAGRLTGSQIGSNSFVQATPTCVIRPSPAMGWFLKPNDPHSVWVFSPEDAEGHRITAPSDSILALRLPAPWYFVFVLPLAAVLLALAWKARVVEAKPFEDSIANLGVSDGPLEWEDDDAMGFHAIARGVSLFLRNSSTRLPLVLAVDGPWGSGKSSLMNLLRANMRDSAQTIWFNAWHHQSEEQLLAALLQSVRVQSLAYMSTLMGLGRRIKLLLLRLKSIWPTATILASLSILLLCAIIRLISILISQESLASSQVAVLIKGWTGLITSIVALIAVLKKLQASVGSLIANPASLLSSYSGSVTISDLNAQTTFRQRFSNDFNKLIQVLGDRRLVIIIDDLDRCRPEKLREIMEAINFLVTSGRCAIVLGIARPYVEYFLGHSFKDVVEDMPTDLFDLANAGASEIVDKPTFYARLYLEKLIQIEVPIPSMSDAQARAIINQQSSDPARIMQSSEAIDSRSLQQIEKQRRFQVRSQRVTRILDRWALPVLGSLSLGFALSYTVIRIGKPVFEKIELGLTARDTKSSSPSSETTVGNVHIKLNDHAVVLSDSKATPSETPDAQGQMESRTGRGNTAPSTEVSTLHQSQGSGYPPLVPNNVSIAIPPPTFVIPDRDVPAWSIAIIFGIIFLAFSALLLRVALSTVESLTVNDSPRFKTALLSWIPLIHRVCHSPRALKRYMNKVRFLAMLQRGMTEADPVPLIDRWVGNLAKRLYPVIQPQLTEAGNSPTADTIPDDILIVLVALENDVRLWRWLTGSTQLTTWTSVAAGNESLLGSLSSELITKLQEIWPQLQEHLERYFHLTGQVNVEMS